MTEQEREILTRARANFGYSRIIDVDLLADVYAIVMRQEAEIKRLQAALARIAGGGEHYDSAAHLMRIAAGALTTNP